MCSGITSRAVYYWVELGLVQPVIIDGIPWFDRYEFAMVMTVRFFQLRLWDLESIKKKVARLRRDHPKEPQALPYRPAPKIQPQLQLGN